MISSWISVEMDQPFRVRSVSRFSVSSRSVFSFKFLVFFYHRSEVVWIMQFSAPEPDVRVQRINILLVNKNSVDTYAFLEALNRSTLRVLHAGPKQIRLVQTEWGVKFFLWYFLCFSPMFFYRFRQGLSLSLSLTEPRVRRRAGVEGRRRRVPAPLAASRGRRGRRNDAALLAKPPHAKLSQQVQSRFQITR